MTQIELHVTAPEGVTPTVVLAAVRMATVEYQNTWGDHFTVSYSVDAMTVVPYVADPEDNPETPKCHVWVVFIPND